MCTLVRASVRVFRSGFVSLCFVQGVKRCLRIVVEE